MKRSRILMAVILVMILGLTITGCNSKKDHVKDTAAQKEPATEQVEKEDKEEKADSEKEDSEKEEPEKKEEQESEEPEIILDESKVEEPVKPQNPQPSSKVEAIPGQHRDPNKIVVVIDPGHQLRGNSVKEPNGPGSSVMKARVTSGTTGRFTGIAEYILNLQVSLQLRTELQNRGYTVYMTRDNHNVDISNMERAQYASKVGADIAVRIHANGSNNPTVQGALTMAPSSNNPYVSHLANASYSLSKKVIDAYCAATGFENDGVLLSDTMTGMNWSSVPVTIVEMGYMSNEHDDRAMQDATMQNNMVQGIANGIDAYFGL